MFSTHYKEKCVSNLALLHILVDESHKGALSRSTSSSSPLPPLTRDETAVNDPVPSMVQGYSRSHINRSFLNVFYYLFPCRICICFSLGRHPNTPKTSPQNMPQYSNVFHDRARRGFCYWLIEKQASTCKYWSEPWQQRSVTYTVEISAWCDINMHMWLGGVRSILLIFFIADAAAQPLYTILKVTDHRNPSALSYWLILVHCCGQQVIS